MLNSYFGFANTSELESLRSEIQDLRAAFICMLNDQERKHALQVEEMTIAFKKEQQRSKVWRDSYRSFKEDILALLPQISNRVEEVEISSEQTTNAVRSHAEAMDSLSLKHLRLEDKVGDTLVKTIDAVRDAMERMGTEVASHKESIEGLENFPLYVPYRYIHMTNRLKVIVSTSFCFEFIDDVNLDENQRGFMVRCPHEPTKRQEEILFRALEKCASNLREITHITNPQLGLRVEYRQDYSLRSTDFIKRFVQMARQLNPSVVLSVFFEELL